MTLTEIRRRLGELGIHPSRRLSQNFLCDQNVARRIVELAEIQRDEPVLEIGPGLGALTEFIVERQPEPALIEKDRRLAGFLRSQFPKARIIEGDALEEVSDCGSFGRLGAGFQISDFVILGNLPYSIASPLMVQLCESNLRPARMIFTIQREVAQRLVARPQSSDYGLLTLLTRPFYEIEIARKVSPTVFWPEPEVSSAVVIMKRRIEQPFANADAELIFRKRVSTAFQKRRKTLGAIFGKDPPSNADRNRRPEELTVDEWIQSAHCALPTPRSAFKEETFDVVNERDEVIGRERRSEVHQKNLLHRAVHIFIWNRRGDLLLQKRSSQKEVAPGAWDSSVAGHLGAGEDYDDAARREMIEELGISVRLGRIQKFEARAELGWEFVRLYEGKSKGPFSFPKEEISEVRWWKPADITAAVREHPADFAPSFIHIWKTRTN